eukprot:CAMPEP_0184871498 /NCGR_PEP_ID=MMETSP0580-20130426/40752_1 /TAXON_ID=1118495 /ORGANISM="Dactyliosolen fragilissimus" /LENGTH=287 /DNA_ID=CAMNT_0027374163 /DNA_START=839 /DNA_END=1699 /DNA_ORIENTATION=-
MRQFIHIIIYTIIAEHVMGNSNSQTRELDNVDIINDLVEDRTLQARNGKVLARLSGIDGSLKFKTSNSNLNVYDNTVESGNVHHKKNTKEKYKYKKDGTGLTEKHTIGSHSKEWGNKGFTNKYGQTGTVHKTSASLETGKGKGKGKGGGKGKGKGGGKGKGSTRSLQDLKEDRTLQARNGKVLARLSGIDGSLKFKTSNSNLNVYDNTVESGNVHHKKNTKEKYKYKKDGTGLTEKHTIGSHSKEWGNKGFTNKYGQTGTVHKTSASLETGKGKGKGKGGGKGKGKG